jgi:hypothetical protein
MPYYGQSVQSLSSLLLARLVDLCILMNGFYSGWSSMTMVRANYVIWHLEQPSALDAIG